MIHNHTALYSDLDIEYQQEYSGPYMDISKETDRGVCIAGMKNNKITGFGRPMVMFGTDRFQKIAINGLWRFSQDIEYMDYLIDGKVSPATKFLLGKGYEAVPYFTQVIDLTWNEHVLKSELRKSYKSLVTKNSVCSDDKLDVYLLKGIHVGVCGRHTRSSKTWHLQAKMVLETQAFLSFDKNYGSSTDKGAGCMFYVNGDWAYYAVGKTTGPDMHSLVWSGILSAKAMGIKYFEMGEQVFTDDKAGNISKFKRGFGGTCKTRLLVRRKENGKY